MIKLICTFVGKMFCVSIVACEYRRLSANRPLAALIAPNTESGQSAERWLYSQATSTGAHGVYYISSLRITVTNML